MRKARGWVLELSISAVCALCVFVGLEFSASAPGQRRAIEALEAQASARSGMRLSRASLADRKAARGLCTGSLARAVGDLERSGSSHARQAGIDELGLRVGTSMGQGGVFVAPVDLTFEGPTPHLGVQLAQLGTVAPSVFLDKVAVRPSPDGRGQALVEIRGRLACARP